MGQGSYGRVNRAEWKGDNVAVKEFEEDDWETYETELDQLSRVNHPNIIRLLASSRENNLRFLVMEYADRGSLYKGQCAITSGFVESLWKKLKGKK